jgi:hypothetical protein
MRCTIQTGFTGGRLTGLARFQADGAMEIGPETDGIWRFIQGVANL